MNLQQKLLGTSHQILGESLVMKLQSLRFSWTTTLMAFGGATVAQLYKMVKLINPRRIPSVVILIGTYNMSRGPDLEEVR